MKQRKYNVIYINNTVNIWAFTEKEAKKKANAVLKENNVKDKFVKVETPFEDEIF